MAGREIAVLFVVSECAPLVKTGGLADVAGALPRALEAFGCAVRVLLPAYPGVAEQTTIGGTVMQEDDFFGGPARVGSHEVGPSSGAPTGPVLEFSATHRA